MARLQLRNSGFDAYKRNFRNNTIPPQAMASSNFKYAYDEFLYRVIGQAPGGGAATGTAGDINQFVTGSVFAYPVEMFVIGTQTIKLPIIATTGLNVALDQTNADGAEYIFGAPHDGTARGRLGFTSRTDKAFFMRMKFSIADASGTDALYFGWKKATAANATWATGATDYACFAILTSADPAVIKTTTRLNSGTATTTTTSATWADAASKTLSIRVDGNGYATFLIDGASVGGEVGFRFDAGDVLVPIFRYTNSSDVAGDVIWQTLEIGYQDRSF